MTLEEKLAPFIKDMNQCVVNGQNYAALTIALMLPDICSSLDQNEYGSKVRKRYEMWMDRFFIDLEGYSSKINSTDFYKLRCAYLHSGTDDIPGKNIYDDPILRRIRFSFGNIGLHKVDINYENEQIHILYLSQFCAEMTRSVERFISLNKNNPTVENNAKKITLLLDTNKPFSI